MGGQLERDAEHRLYLIYPTANWVEVSYGSPYYVIGESSYGKPLLDRALRHETPMVEALKIGYLAFDAARRSANDVDFPLDVVLYRRDTHSMVEHRFERQDLQHISDWWQQRIRAAVNECPEEWTQTLLSRLPPR